MKTLTDVLKFIAQKKLRIQKQSETQVKAGNGTDWLGVDALRDGEFSVYGSGRWEEELKAWLAGSEPRKQTGRKITVKVDIDQAFADLSDSKEVSR